MLHNMDKHPEPEEQAENIPPEAKTSKLKFQSTDVGQHFREENGPPPKTCACSTPATGESKSRLSGVLSTLSPIFRYFNIENKQSPPQSVKCAPSSSCLKSAGKSAHHHNLNFSTLHSGTPLAATHRPYCLLDYECLPEMTLLDDTNNTTMQLTTDDSAYHRSGPPAAKPNAIMCGEKINTSSPVCPPQPPETQKLKSIKLSEMKHSSVWNQLLDGNLPEITFLDDSSYLETTAGVQTASDGMVQDIMQDLALDKTQDMVKNETQDMVQDMAQDIESNKTQDLVIYKTQDMVQDIAQDKTQDVVQDIAQDVVQDISQDKTQDVVQDKTQDMVQDIAQDKTQDMVQDIAQDKTQDMVQDIAQDKTQDMVQDIAQDKTQDLEKNMTRDMVQNLTQNMTQDMVQVLAQDKTQDMVPVLAQDKTQDMVPVLAHDMAQDLAQNKTQDLEKNMTQDMVQNLTQNMTQDMVQVLAQDKTQDMVPVLAQDKTQDMVPVLVQDMVPVLVQDMVQVLAQNKTQDLEKNMTQDMVQNLTQNMMQDMAQDAIDHVTQPASDPSAETAPKFDTVDILTNRDLSSASVVTIKTSFEVTPNVTINSTLKNNRSLEPNLQNTVKPQVSVDSGPASRQNDTFECKHVSGQNGIVTLSEISLKETPGSSLDQPKLCNATTNLNHGASDVLNPELTEQNKTPDSAETRPKMVENPEGTFETPPALELLSGGDGCQREDPSQPGLHETMELSDSSIISSMDTNNANALILDKTLDSLPNPRTSSTPMTNLKLFNLKTHKDEGQVPAAQKKLYQDGLSKPADQVPSEIPSNIVADRKTFLSQTGSKLLWPPSKEKHPQTSQLPKISNLGVKSTIPRKQEPLQSNLPIKRQRFQDAVRKPAPPEGPQGITEKQSPSSSSTRTAVFKLPASGIQRPQMSKMAALSKPASALKRLPTRSNSQVLARADKPCESKALKTMTNNLEERKRRLTKGEALPLSKKQNIDAVKQLSSTEANSRILNQPAVRQRSLLTKAQKHGCANCSALEEQLKLKTQEIERLQEELLKYTRKT
ncbi:uncharacterized protein LOC101174539 isoform X2 [Oryzias latipes]|uniref:uncharacterized protein LOC101174539 isoform X3 n=1 Tax=Oryzias latipes TaxID=8090 RepID=UPI0009D9EB82|nr:uncharacterized protein LOC101174539 isoform X3 [Oryzias latipes]XP_023805010.1 uncharacterized protein LOC101174539 isoform X2 [Oryzias latipes]